MPPKPTDITDELIASMHEAAPILPGEAEPAKLHLPPDTPDVRAIRARLDLTRPAFARRFGLAVAAVRDWEQDLRRPDPAARVLLMVIARTPDAVAEAVAESHAAWRPLRQTTHRHASANDPPKTSNRAASPTRRARETCRRAPRSPAGALSSALFLM